MTRRTQLHQLRACLSPSFQCRPATSWEHRTSLKIRMCKSITCRESRARSPVSLSTDLLQPTLIIWTNKRIREVRKILQIHKRRRTCLRIEALNESQVSWAQRSRRTPKVTRLKSLENRAQIWSITTVVLVLVRTQIPASKRVETISNPWWVQPIRSRQRLQSQELWYPKSQYSNISKPSSIRSK